MYNSEGTVRIISIFFSFLLKSVLKGLWTCVQNFGKIYYPVTDLWTSRRNDMTRAKVCKSDQGL